MISSYRVVGDRIVRVKFMQSGIQTGPFSGVNLAVVIRFIDCISALECVRRHGRQSINKDIVRITWPYAGPEVAWPGGIQILFSTRHTNHIIG